MRKLTDTIKSWLHRAPSPLRVEVPPPIRAPTPVPSSRPAENSRDEYELLETLIDRLSDTPVMTAAEEAALDAKRREKMTDWIGLMLDEGQAYAQASGNLPIYNQPEEGFRSEIRATDNDLRTQIDRFNFGLDRWFEMGESHPPYWPWRIVVILSKRKDLDREKRFLAAYCRHFWKRKGRRDEMILERAEKKGAFDRFNRPS